MIVHILIYITQEAGSDDADYTSRNTSQIDPLVAVSVRKLASKNDHFPGRIVVANAWDSPQLIDETRAGQSNGFSDEFWIRYVHGDHCAADVFDSVWHEL